MPEAPTGIESLPLKYLRNLIASCAAFQSWVGAGSETAALDYIGYEESASKGGGGEFVVVGEPGLDEDPTFALLMVGEDNAAATSGQLMLMFSSHRDKEATEADQRMTLRNTLGAIVEQMTSNRGGQGSGGARLVFSSIKRYYLLLSDKEDHQGINPFIEAGYVVDYDGSPV